MNNSISYPILGSSKTFTFGNRLYHEPNFNTGMFSGIVGYSSGNPSQNFIRTPVLSSNSNNMGTSLNPITPETVAPTTPIQPVQTTLPTTPVTNLGSFGKVENGLNWHDASVRSQYGLSNWDSEAFTNRSTTPNWYGKETPTVSINHSGAFDMLNQDPIFKSYFQAQTPEVQAYIQANVGSHDWRNINNADMQIKQAMASKQNSAWTSQNTLSAIQTGAGVATSLANLYMGYKQHKLAEKQLNETLALQRANYRNQARAMNTQYRDQMSGRGSTVMSGSAKRKLGEMYANRRVSETY